jgi:hypothetical protein
MKLDRWIVVPMAAGLLLALAGCNPVIEGDEAGECDDGVDNDQDGTTDCDDSGCEAAFRCEGLPVRADVRGTGGRALWKVKVQRLDGNPPAASWVTAPPLSEVAVGAETLEPWACRLSAEADDRGRPTRVLFCQMIGSQSGLATVLTFDDRHSNTTMETLLVLSPRMEAEVSVLGILGDEG